jgi:hypothetical protein
VQYLDETRLVALNLRKVAAHVVEQLARRKGNGSASEFPRLVKEWLDD